MGDWRSYDDVAETYERVHAGRFAEVARDMLDMTGIPPDAAILDVGTGTGIAAQVAAARGASTVGIDHSLGMLSVGHRVRPDVRLVAARAIDLPFRNDAFDAAIGNFVLAHFTDYTTALFDILRTVRSGGRVAFSSWADGIDTYQATWRELIESVVPREMLAPAYAEAAPWHEKFRKRDATEAVLIDARLRHVRSEVMKYRWTYPLDDYLDGLEVWAIGRFVHEMLGEGGWEDFKARARSTFADRFPDPLNDFREVILAVGTKT